MAIETFGQSDDDRRAQKEWIFKLKNTSTLLARSAAQAQRNFDQYLTAMEHVAALYKDYGALLSVAKESFLMIKVDIPDLPELKARTARMHSVVHKWEHSESLYAVRNHLHVQTDVLKSRSALAAKALDTCAEREDLMSSYVMKSAKLVRKLRKQAPEAEALQKEVEKLERRISKVNVMAQRDVEVAAVKSSASLKDLTGMFLKAMYKNGCHVQKHFHPDRVGGEDGDSSASVADLNGEEDAVTGFFGGSQSANSSIAASGIYGVNRNRFHAAEAHPPTIVQRNDAQNSGIPLRYDADATSANATATTAATA